MNRNDLASLSGTLKDAYDFTSISRVSRMLSNVYAELMPACLSGDSRRLGGGQECWMILS